jgi:hypothetical protein
MNFMLGFSFIYWILEDCPELIILAILFGFITFLSLTSLVISKNKTQNKAKDLNFLGKTAYITDFIVKSHKHHIYIGNVEGFIIFVYSNNPLELNSYVTLTSYNNDKYFV